MTVKILSSTSTFNGVAYNTNKTQSAKGELMHFKNFGYLQNASKVTPSEMKTFLKAHSNRNTRVKGKQFHAMISCKGREYDKMELTQMAEAWLHKMGYGGNPYLIVFHGDTANNHVHMVSSRIDNQGKKINDSMERVRAQKCMQEILDQHPGKDCTKALEELQAYRFSTLPQARLYLELRGYSLREREGKLELIKFGYVQGSIGLDILKSKMLKYSPQKARAKQVSALIHKYKKLFDSTPVPVYEPLKGQRLGRVTGYRSELGDYLKEKLGLEIIFHGKDGKQPYGYTLLDHGKKNIFKGSEVLPLKALTANESKGKIKLLHFPSEVDKQAYLDITGTRNTLFRYRNLPDHSTYRLKLLSALHEYPNLQLGLAAYRFNLLLNNKKLYLLDTETQFFVALDTLLGPKDYNRFAAKWDVPPLEEQFAAKPSDHRPIQERPLTGHTGKRSLGHDSSNGVTLPALDVDIQEDVNEEVRHGKRKNKANNHKNRSIR